MKIGIIGVGEVGLAISKIYQEINFDIKILDPGKGFADDLYGSDILNICYPYSNDFVEITNNYVNMFKPHLTVIHSSVLPGTTHKILGRVCHSPIRGKHPNLEEGIKLFVKYIGSDDPDVSYDYKRHLDNLGIENYVCKNSQTSEFAKLLDTTYYGLCIAFHNEVAVLCENQNIEFDEVMTKFNETYNDGYSKMLMKNVIRPVLKPGIKIGGHCVVPNAKLLQQVFPSALIQAILKYE